MIAEEVRGLGSPHPLGQAKAAQLAVAGTKPPIWLSRVSGNLPLRGRVAAAKEASTRYVFIHPATPPSHEGGGGSGYGVPRGFRLRDASCCGSGLARRCPESGQQRLDYRSSTGDSSGLVESYQKMALDRESRAIHYPS